MQRPQAFGHDILSWSVSSCVNPRSANPSQLRPACRIALQVNPILDRNDASSRQSSLLDALPGLVGEFCTLLCSKFLRFALVRLRRRGCVFADVADEAEAAAKTEAEAVDELKDIANANAHAAVVAIMHIVVLSVQNALVRYQFIEE